MVLTGQCTKNSVPKINPLLQEVLLHGDSKNNSNYQWCPKF